MEKVNPVLVILAAGMGSRYGGFKQIAPVDTAGHIIIDYSLYDAYRAGFRDIICIIKPSMENDFVEHFKHASLKLNISYAYQTMQNLPEGFSVPPERQKPWGTAHAILCTKNLVKGPFAVINADDFYGANSFKIIYDFLENMVDPTHHAMIGFKVENTLSDSGSVTRGVCSAHENKLVDIQEISEIVPAPTGAKYTKGSDIIPLPAGTIVSMNMWGFNHGVIDEIENLFEPFLINNVKENPLKCEYLLPTVVGELLTKGKATVEILPTSEKWHGITYIDDMPAMRAALEQMKKSDIYPELLWKEK